MMIMCQNIIGVQYIFSQKYYNQNQIIIKQMQDCKVQLPPIQTKQQNQWDSQTFFLTLNSDFKFMVIATINKAISLLAVQGRLIFNNGSTVFINIGHLSFVNHYLNSKFKPPKNKILFQIDQSSETLIFTGKINNIKDFQTGKAYIKLFQQQVLRRKKCIFAVLAVVGVALDNENALMRRILIEKKKLKNRLQQILRKSVDKVDECMQVQEQKSEQEGGVIYFGKGTDYELVQEMQEEGQSKSLEGGYFSIESTPFVVKDREGRTISKQLVVKTLRQKRRKQEGSLSQNQIKMKKQIQIVSSIKNKKYLIKYYCDAGSFDNLSEVYMDQYDHSLQQYIHYRGDSLEYLHKINISKQVVDAILTLHQSGVIHRDIKPANFLIDDDNSHSNHFRVKIIDFAESYPSYAKQKIYSNIDYACSHPYSPLECIDRKGFTQNGPMEGIGRKQIDYWSVGITIYQIFFRKLPVSFSRAFLVDITSSWKTELLVAVNQRQKTGFGLVDEIINIICVKMMKFSQDQRMRLTLTKKILEYLEVYIQNLLQIVEESL